MKESLVGTQAFGLRMPLIKEGSPDELLNTILDRYTQFGGVEGDIICVTESIVARNAGMYVSYQDVGDWIKRFKPSATNLILISPIFSRNRFGPILRGLLTADNINKVIVVSREMDEVGNLVNHQCTGVNYKDYYKMLVESAGKEFQWEDMNMFSLSQYTKEKNQTLVIDCRLHANNRSYELSLKDILSEVNNWGLLGMNAAGERIKLFPNKNYSQWFVEVLQQRVKIALGINVDVMIYGDGAFKCPTTGIWEWADPVVSPGWTKGLDGSPTETKLKNSIDSGMSEQDIMQEIELNRMTGGQAFGTTPRRIVEQVGSLADLVSGSGDKGTPVVVIRGYTKKYID